MAPEAPRMKAILTIVVAALLVGSAQAGEVFKTKDDKGNPIYTDKPDTLPAQKLDVKSHTTDTVEVQKRYDQQMKGYAAGQRSASDAARQGASQQQAAALSAEDKAKRCLDARDRYQQVMNSPRLYTQAEGDTERRYLTSEEIDAARANAKKVMDEFCAGQ
jgi:hypothetical protein